MITGPMALGWLANTTLGRMVGDYISTSFGSAGLAHAAFATATAPTSGTNCGDVTDNCTEPTDTTASGLAALSAGHAAAGDRVVGSGTPGAGNGLERTSQ